MSFVPTLVSLAESDTTAWSEITVEDSPTADGLGSLNYQVSSTYVYGKAVRKTVLVVAAKTVQSDLYEYTYVGCCNGDPWYDMLAYVYTSKLDNTQTCKLCMILYGPDVLLSIMGRILFGALIL